jgi:transposase
MLQHKQGTARDQISFSSFEDRISRDNPIRFIAIFSGKLDLEKIGFSVKTLQKEGRPSFESSLFVRLYLYGYLNGLRSSRKLEKECERNIELHWLLHGMTPNYHSISDFRKDNPQALKKLFKLFDHNGRQIQECTEASITTIVASPELVNSNEKGTTKAYTVTEFIYTKEADTYTCPQGETLTTAGTRMIEQVLQPYNMQHA